MGIQWNMQNVGQRKCEGRESPISLELKSSEEGVVGGCSSYTGGYSLGWTRLGAWVEV